MPSEPLIEREIVRTDAALVALCDELRAAGRFALDTEFVGERTYIAKLCLVQVATTRFIALVDTQAIQDLTPFLDLVADASLQKVLHAAREDLRLSYYGGGRLIPRNIFDTQVAAGLVGLPMYPLSYARLVEALAGVRLSKAETRSEWDRRPLTPDQIRYARDDVRYLLEIEEKLGGLMARLGRTDWMREEMDRFSDPSLYEAEPELAYLRIRGPRAGMTARPTALLRAVASWREREAALRNIPTRLILRDEVLMEIALRPPRRLHDFTRLRGFPEGEEVTLGPPLLEVLQNARELPEEELPPPLIGGGDEETPVERASSDLVFALSEALCLAGNVAPELAVTKASALALVRGRLPSALLSGWRYELLGQSLQSLISGRGSVHLRVHQGTPSVTFLADSPPLDETSKTG